MQDFWLPSVLLWNENDHSILLKKYGERPVMLAKLNELTQVGGFSVPKFGVLPISFSVECNTRSEALKALQGESLTYEERVMLIESALAPEITSLLKLAIENGLGEKPILRASYPNEGLYNELSFAGVCQSAIPKAGTDPIQHMCSGMARILSGNFTTYAQYYLRLHSLDATNPAVSVVIMKMIERPILHATAYVYEDEVCLRYFVDPEVGHEYAGGYEAIVSRKGADITKLPGLPSSFSNIWKRIFKVFALLYQSFYGKSTPLDIEFLIDQNDSILTINVVQIRRISTPHLCNKIANYELDQIERFDIFVSRSHVYHSVGKLSGRIVDMREKTREAMVAYMMDGVEPNSIFIINHEKGKKTLDFLRFLPKNIESRVAILIGHPKIRSHDHLQYAIFEDHRFQIIVHCEEQQLGLLHEGDLVTIEASGKQVGIKINQKTITHMTSQPQFTLTLLSKGAEIAVAKVSAVFLIGFTEDKIVAARNERGWDVPGGHLDPGEGLLDGLRREVNEEAGASFKNAIPYATLSRVDKDKVMVFFASDSCELNDFTPKLDALERELMFPETLIERYYGDKELLNTLIQEAQKILKP